MSFINHSSKEMYCKIIYAGPPSAGKTSNIQWIYQKTNTQNREPDPLPNPPPSTELFDFLPVGVGMVRGFSTRFHLFTMVQPELFHSTGKILLKGLDGVVFVADSHPLKTDKNMEYLSQFKTHLKNEGYMLEKIPFVIQYNKRDLKNAEPLLQMRKHLNLYNCLDFQASAKTGEGVMDTFKAISKIILDHLKGS